MGLDAAGSRKILDKLLAQAKKVAPGASVRAQLTHGHTGNTRFARSQITSSADVTRVEATVELGFGQRHASATMNQLDDASLHELVARAARLARLAPEDPEWMAPVGPQRYVAIKNAYDAGTDTLRPAARAQAAAAAMAAGRAHKLDVAGYYEHSGGSRALADSAGLFAHHQSSHAGFTCTARTADATGSGWAGASSQRAADVDAAAAAAIAVDKAVKSAKPKRLEAGRYTVVLEPAAVASLMTFLLGSLDARRADEGRSFFSKPGGGTRVGDTLFGPEITLASDPTDAALGVSPFDEEGLPSPAARWIDKGKLTGLVYSRFWGKKTGKPATGRPGGWVLGGGTTPRADLVKGVKRGVLVTRFWYLRIVDPQSVLVTGLTRDGVFLIENGEIVAPVNNFRFNESPAVMLKNVEALAAAEIAPDGSMRAPALRTAGFNLASVSDAV
jgi:predicted Zn-dependent protease